MSQKQQKQEFKLRSIYPNYDETPAMRRQARPSLFIRTVKEHVNLRNLQRCNICEDLNAKTRNKILSLISVAEKLKQIRFSRTELSILFHMYVELAGREIRNLTCEELKTFLYSTLDITNPFSLDGLCRAATQTTKSTIASNKKAITPIDFVSLLSTMLRGSVIERAELAFRVIDLDSDGLLRRNVEFRRLLHETFDVSVAAQNPEIDPEEPVRDTINYLCDKMQCTLTQPVTLEKFQKLVTDEPWITESLLPCIPSEVTNLVFQNLFNLDVILPSLERT